MKLFNKYYIGFGYSISCWEIQIHRFWLRIHYPSYWKSCGIFDLEIIKKENTDAY